VPQPDAGEIALIDDPKPPVVFAFEQGGWRVNIESRIPAMGFSLPQKLTIERDGARLKLFVDRWQP
jgi:outer membrane biogenesis lipoprotein LolB